ncbi:MAG: 4-phosphoerythronate dehydrogenase [Sedimentisphaerales bacterium]|nr:4-phosphoerythronate dehydrogenase [Sedimentisphaerales bacterium]
MKIIADTNIPFVKECFSSLGDIELVGGREISPKTAKDADVLLVRSITKINEQLLAGSRVKFVGTATIGFEHIDMDYLNSNSIGFASAPGSNANSVAEYVIAALLEVAEKHNVELEGKTIGIVGVGNVGSKVEQKCCALGMVSILNDPPLQRQTGDEKYRPIEELYGCDFITMHTPLTYEGQDKTFHLADEKFFQPLKSGVVFLNTSRGGVVDTAALKKAIKNEKIKAAVLDVWENEPDIDTELLEMVDIGTPHIAGYSFDGKVAGMIMIYKALCGHFNLQPEHSAEDFLSGHKTPDALSKTSITFPQAPTGREGIKAVVNEIYNIKEDDKRLRAILNMPLGKRCATFDKLRREYPVRREFQNTNILLATEKFNKATEDTESTEILRKKLEGIGFKIKR